MLAPYMSEAVPEAAGEIMDKASAKSVWDDMIAKSVARKEKTWEPIKEKIMAHLDCIPGS